MRPKPRRRIFLRCQRSFPSSAFFQAVTLRFCCRAAESWPRAPLLVTISLYRLSDQAARVNCSSAVDFLPPFKESEATPVARSSLRSRRRNRSAPDRHCFSADNSAARTINRCPKATGEVRHCTIEKSRQAKSTADLVGCCVFHRANELVSETLKERNHVGNRFLSCLHVVDAGHHLFSGIGVSERDIRGSEFGRC